jgi:Ca2+-binding EF-hand superfamily protein
MEVTYMQITKITDKHNTLAISKKTYLSDEELQREFDYYRAEKLLNQMLENGLITEEEFKKIMLLNRETFSPMLAQIMPDIP